MSLSINLTGMKKIPEAVYKLRVTDYEVKQKDGAEFPYIMWSLDFLDGPKAGESVREITSLNPKAIFRLKNLAEAAGYDWPDADETDADEFDFDPKDMLKAVIYAHVGTREYEGQPQTTCIKFFPDEDAAEEFAEKLAKKLGN